MYNVVMRLCPALERPKAMRAVERKHVRSDSRCGDRALIGSDWRLDVQVLRCDVPGRPTTCRRDLRCAEVSLR